MSRQLLREGHVNCSGNDDMSPECHVDGVGEALVFSLKTSHQLKTWGLVYRPVPGTLTKVKVKDTVGPIEGPEEGG